MHTSSLFGDLRPDMKESGWNIGDNDDVTDKNKAFNWEKMVGNVQKHIISLNSSIKEILMNSGVM